MLQNASCGATSKAYSNEDILLALAELRAGNSYRYVSNKYAIPKTTLQDKMKGKSAHYKMKPGPKAILKPNEKEKLVDYILYMSKIGYGISKSKLPCMIKEMLENSERDCDTDSEDRRFKENKPSINWVHRFLFTDPKISSCMPENLSILRNPTETNIKIWFGRLTTFLMDDHNICCENFLVPGNASRIFALGECQLYVSKEGPKFRNRISVLACTSANGKFSKPLVICPEAIQAQSEFHITNRQDFAVEFTANGRLDTESFFSWFSLTFLPSIWDKVLFPIIIFMDCKMSLINLTVFDFCKENGIILYCLPPNSRQILQPLDVAVFALLQKFWKKAMKNLHNTNKYLVTKSRIYQVFSKAWKKTNEKVDLVAGFRNTGLVPFNPNAVNYHKLKDSSSDTTENLMVNHPEQLGISRCLRVVKNVLSHEQISLFEHRIQEGLNLPDQSQNGKLFEIYNSITRMFIEYQLENNELTDENNNLILPSTHGKTFNNLILPATHGKTFNHSWHRARGNKRKHNEFNYDEVQVKLQQHEPDEQMQILNSASKKFCLKNIGQYDCICAMCRKFDNWSDVRKWVNCNSCYKWFHKACLSNEVEDMNYWQLLYDFDCSMCVLPVIAIKIEGS